MGLTERHWFENEDVPENYEWALEDAVCCSHTIEECTQNGGWISVEDRLPENKIVLVSVVTKSTGHRWETPIIGEIVHGKWFLETEGTIADNVGVIVTHWMPLPEPPEEEKP